MKKQSDSIVEIGMLFVLMILWIILMSILLLGMVTPARAQDAALQPVICRDADYGYGSFVIRVPSEWNNPDLASWWVLADGFGAYANPSDGVTFRADALTHVDVYGEGNPQWMQDLQIGDLVVGSGDYSVIVVANQTTVECDENDYPVSTPVPPVPTLVPTTQVQSVASTERTCTVQYPQIILVCNG